MKNALSNEFEAIKAGPGQAASSMAMLPLLRVNPARHSYFSLHQALAEGSLVIGEVSQGGSVPELKVSNKGQQTVLILDGEELRGAKQNRVLNTCILVGPESTLTVPVSCTEAGRWSYESPVFRESCHIMSPSSRSGLKEDVQESLRMSGQARSNQGRVWDDIRLKHEQHGTRSGTGAMSDIFAGRAQDLEQILEAFPLLEGQCGICAFFGDRFAGLDFVSLPSVWKDLHDKIIRSYALDALRTRQEAQLPKAEQLGACIDQLSKCQVEAYPGVGLGEDLRLKQQGLIGSALLWQEELAHLSAYPPHNAVTGEYDRYQSPRHRSRGF